MGYSEQELEIPIDSGVTLRGTLTTPDVKDPNLTTLVIFVAGSGPIDRDENANGIQLNVFNTLARALAEGKPSSLVDSQANATVRPSFRYDKRGTGKSTGTFNTAGLNDLFQDLIAVLDYFLTTKGTTNFILVGHSEGTLLSAMASAERPDSVASLVLICPFVTPMEDILIQQGKHIDRMQAEADGISGCLQRTMTKFCIGGSVEAFQKRLIQRIKENQTDTIRVMLFSTIPARWFREHFAMEYEAVYRNVQTPTVLLLVAECDVQCDPKDGERILHLLPADSRHTLQIMPKLSHLLRREGDHNKGFADYGPQLKTDMDSEAILAVVAWCSKLSIPS